jgi:hypothetical protein
VTVDVNALHDLADLWEKSGERIRRDKNEVASALVGCAQALRNVLPEREAAE